MRKRGTLHFLGDLFRSDLSDRRAAVLGLSSVRTLVGIGIFAYALPQHEGLQYQQALTLASSALALANLIAVWLTLRGHIDAAWVLAGLGSFLSVFALVLIAGFGIGGADENLVLFEGLVFFAIMIGAVELKLPLVIANAAFWIGLHVTLEQLYGGEPVVERISDLVILLGVWGLATVGSRIIYRERKEAENKAEEAARLAGSLKQQVDRMTALHDLTEIVSSSRSLKPALDGLLDKVSGALRLEASIVFLSQSGTFALQAAAVHDEQGFLAHTGLQDSLRTSATRALASRVTERCENTTVQRDGVKGPGALAYGLCVPLAVRNEPVGVLALSRTSGQYAKEEQDFIETVASETSLAIQKAIHQEQTEQRLREVEGLNRLMRGYLDQRRQAIEGLAQVVEKARLVAESGQPMVALEMLKRMAVDMAGIAQQMQKPPTQ